MNLVNGFISEKSDFTERHKIYFGIRSIIEVNFRRPDTSSPSLDSARSFPSRPDTG